MATPARRASSGLARAVGRAVRAHAPGVGRERAGEDRHERALAGAVLADQARRPRPARPPGPRRPAPPWPRTPCGCRASRSRRGAFAALRFAEPGCGHLTVRARSSSRSHGRLSMFSRVTTWTPVSMRVSTFSPLRCDDHGLHAQVAHLQRVLQDETVDVAVSRPFTRLSERRSRRS